MSFPIAELITTAVIENRLAFLMQRPDHLNWMLSPLMRSPEVANLVGARHVAECVQYIMNNRLMVRPVNEADLAKLPSIVVAAHQGESEQFVGDYGMLQDVTVVDPTVIATFDVVEIDDNIIKTPTTGVADRVWPNLWARSGDFASRISAVVAKEDGSTWLYLTDAPPTGTALRGWQATTSCTTVGYSLGASIDSVKVNVTLTTVGDHAIHRLLATLVRYCLKSGRPMFDSQGMQVATFSQQPVTLVDPDQLIWQTSFSVDAKMTDYWITDEYAIDDSGQVILEVVPDRNIAVERG